MIYKPPTLTSEDQTALTAIHDMRRELTHALRTPRRWHDGLRRTMLARAIRGSNSIEGYVVAEDDAAAALDDEDPMEADQRTFAEIRGYRQALGYVLQMSADPHFVYDTSAIRSMHYMMLAHDLSKYPGQYRTGPIYVYDEKDEQVVYEGPHAQDVSVLMEEFTNCLRSGPDIDPLIHAAMAHLNLVMIHPFSDGNGRMARALQTLVLSRQAISEPAFSSIEEWLGNNTEDYYRVLALTSQGSWLPHHDSALWISFNLRAHHMQAQTLARRVQEAEAIWIELDELVSTHALPPRVTDLLYEAVLGYRLRRPAYVKAAQIEERTATRDLTRLVEVGLLEARGVTKGRYYVAGSTLSDIRSTSREQGRPLTDPYPWMKSELTRQRS